MTTDNSGNLSNEQGHYPFGEQWYATGTADPSVLRKFTTYSKETEATTGQLNYALARELSARIGRFNMTDPVRGQASNPQRLNRYAYVTNDPVNRRDPRGLDPATESRRAFEAPINSTVSRMGFDQFDAIAVTGCTASADCSVGYGWEGLSYDSFSGTWGYDADSSSIFRRWVTDVKGQGTYYTFTREAAGEIATFWNAHYAELHAEERARSKVDNYIETIGLGPYIAEKTAEGKGYKLLLYRGGLEWLQSQAQIGVFQQHGYLWASMHARELEVTANRFLLDFRNGIHPSLHVPVNVELTAENYYRSLAHLDAWNPNGGVAPFVLHWICDVGHAC
jgi:RHS repeat-associated protein